MSKRAKPLEITSLQEWRQTPQLAAWAFKLFSSAEWKLLSQVMQEGEHVRLFDAPGVSADQKLGRIEGWDLYHTRIKSAAQPLEVMGEMPEANFLPEESKEQPQEKE